MIVNGSLERVGSIKIKKNRKDNMMRINKKREIFGFFDLSGFKEGVADALLEGYKADWHKNCPYYAQGYEFGLTMYALCNKLNEKR